MQLKFDEQGQFSAGPLPIGGRWKMGAMRFIRERGFAAPLIERDLDVLLGETTFVNLDLTREPRVSGQVLGPEGEPLEDVSVVIQTKETPVQKIGAVTNADGHYEIGGLKPGAYVLEAKRWLRRTAPG